MTALSVEFITRQTCPLCTCRKPAQEFPCIAAPGLRRCLGCGFIFAKDVPNAENHSLYEESFAAGTVNPTFQRDLDGEYKIRNAAKLDALIESLEPYRSSGRILDVGCSAAFFLSIAKERGWQTNGVEISKWASNFSISELGIDVFNGTLKEAAFPDSTFDVVFSSHVIEHVGDPLSLVKGMRRVLRPGGALVSVLPSQFSSPNWKLRSRFRGDPPPNHVSFFNRRNFALMLRSAGFTTLSTRYNIELMRLYELILTDRQLADRWKARMAAAADPNRQIASTIHSASIGVRVLKSTVNRAGNFLGFGDEIISIAINPGS